jgi:hypothetical protein
MTRVPISKESFEFGAATVCTTGRPGLVDFNYGPEGG